MKKEIYFFLTGFLLICDHINQIFVQGKTFLSSFTFRLELVVVIILTYVLFIWLSKLEKFNNIMVLLLVFAMTYLLQVIFANISLLSQSFSINMIVIYILELVYIVTCGYWIANLLKTK